MKLFLDDERMPHQVGLVDEEWVVVRDAIMAWQAIRNGVVTHLSLDHDLGTNDDGTLAYTGYDLCKWMAEHNQWPTEACFVHTKNPVGRDNMVAVINRYFVPQSERE